ncbi:hypothetical protein TTSV1_gp19 [Thermoproteus tenax spherical virus 1]|uniref:Uncharacterized protein n=1 Tax=Thermoproteus tenax spherical virus 1 TaxID=292639 RepID=Q647E3_9VIRU|nr:hypothetical protein TTSV1_gp19 [Thermoproteus tenax spherical virus 1]AAU25969.1 hypothetical protein [Thermoproteus tenax spherical virus 1]
MSKAEEIRKLITEKRFSEAMRQVKDILSSRGVYVHRISVVYVSGNKIVVITADGIKIVVTETEVIIA